MTSAHCLVDDSENVRKATRDLVKKYLIYGGLYDGCKPHEESWQRSNILKALPHPQYNSSRKSGDSLSITKH